MISEISIITPSFNALCYLKRCHRSVADQERVRAEHIIVDGGSTDGTIEWLESQPGLLWKSEKDRGMYDAINKGFEKAHGEILGYLNCDEQYLPGTLAFVHEYFQQHPKIDILFGDYLLIHPDGTLISFRKGVTPRLSYILASHLYLLSCTMFFRRRVIDDGYRFNADLRDVGDQDFVVRLLRAGYRAAHVRRYLAVFTMRGENMSMGENARRERTKARNEAPLWIIVFRIPLNILRLAEKFLTGAYFQKTPFEYAVYASDDAVERKVFRVTKATFRWKPQ